MKISSDTYVPSLKWRQGEYQALFRLPDGAKKRVVPLITIPSIEYDFEDQRPKKTIEEHVTPFAKRYAAKWGLRPAWIDLDKSLRQHKFSGGADTVEYIFRELRLLGSDAVPVASLSDDLGYSASLRGIIGKDKRGAAIRLRLDELMQSNVATALAAMQTRIGIAESEADLIVELGTPSYEPHADFAKALVSTFPKVSTLGQYRSFVLVGTAFPESLKELSSGALIVRHDWLFYKVLIGLIPSSVRRPSFGDCTIVHPEFTADFDMRVVKPAGKLVYTAKDNWILIKGGAFRDNPTQMHKHCAQIVASGFFRGPSYSEGDDYIARCATKAAGHSTLTRWKEIGISHHMMHVLEDLASFGASS